MLINQSLRLCRLLLTEDRCCNSKFPEQQAAPQNRCQGPSARRRMWPRPTLGQGTRNPLLSTDYLREPLALLRGLPRVTLNLLNSNRLAPYLRNLDRYPMSSSRPSATATRSTADRRWPTHQSWAKPARLNTISKHIPLSLACLAFGPLVCAAAVSCGLLSRAQ